MLPSAPTRASATHYQGRKQILLALKPKLFFYEASGVFATFYLQAQTAFTVMVDDMDVVSNVLGLSQRLSEYKPSSSVKKVKSQ